MLDQQFCDLVTRAVGRAQVPVRVQLLEPGRAKGELGDRSLPFAIGVGLDRRERLSVYVALIQTGISPGAVMKLVSAHGRLDSIEGPDGLEFRVWSRYRVEDLRESRAEAAIWAASTLLATAKALGMPIAAIIPTARPTKPVATPLPEQPVDRAGDGASAIETPAATPVAVTGDESEPDLEPDAPTGAGQEAPVDLVTVAQVEPPRPVSTEPAQGSPAPDVRLVAEEVAAAATAAAEAAAATTRADIAALSAKNDQLAELVRDLLAVRAATEEAPALVVDPLELTRLQDRIRELELGATTANSRAAQLEAEGGALRRAVAAAEDDLRKAQDETTRLAQELRQREPAAASGPSIADLRDQVIRDQVSADQVRAAILRAAIAQQPDDTTAREALAGSLLQLGEVGEAAAVLEAVVDRLTPTGASRLVEAALRGKVVPPLTVFARADWSVGQAAAEFRRTPGWVKPADLASITAALEDNWPPQAGTWLESVAQQLRGPALRAVFDAWTEFDESSAASVLVGWINEGRLTIASEPWAREGLELFGVDSQDRKIQLTAFRQLIDAARRAQDWDTEARIVGLAKRTLNTRDWIQVGTEVVLGDLQGAPARHPALPDLVAELLGLGEAVLDKSDLKELTAAAREIIRLLPSADTASVRELLEAEPDRDPAANDPGASAVTTVYEAVAHARDRFPALDVLKEAEDSARQRGSAGTRQALASMVALGEWAQEFAKGDGPELRDALRLLPGFREDISATSKQQHTRHYDRRLEDGSVIQLGPHLDAGGNGGRIYFYLDESRRKVVVGHVGKHLPGKRDT